MSPTRRRLTLVGVGVTALALVAVVGYRVLGITGATPDGASANPGTNTTPAPVDAEESMPATDPKLAKFYDQELTWTDCEGSSQCSELEVPVDYAKPDGRTVTIKVNRVLASGRSRGVLVVNPGGPGGSGLDYARSAIQWPTAIRDNFDRVGFDPRGVGESTPLDCAGTEEKDEVVAADPDPDTRAERRASDAVIQDFGEGCLNSDAELARHMSTVEVAKDVDVLRAVLGQAKLNWFGASYGTFIGATYANLFPGHVGKMVLDGAVDPSLSNRELSLGQARGFETALRAYVQDCVDRGNCILGDSVEEGTKRIKEFVDDVDRHPLDTNTPRRLQSGNAVYGILLPLYVKTYWPVLTQALTQAIENRDGSSLLTLSDAYSSRTSGGYADNSLEALYNVNCLDHPDTVPSSEVSQFYAEFEKASPTFGRMFAFGLSTCEQWPVKGKAPSKALPAKGAPPIVVIGTTRDPATPVEWAEGLADQLESGVLITRDGDGHTGYAKGNDCVDDAVDAYLLESKTPTDGLTC